MRAKLVAEATTMGSAATGSGAPWVSAARDTTRPTPTRRHWMSPSPRKTPDPSAGSKRYSTASCSELMCPPSSLAPAEALAQSRFA
jgi:hypothetical protein